MSPPSFHLLAKPTGSACNLDCKYCFFLSKETLYPGSKFRMTDDVLESYIRQLLGAQPGPDAYISWQGGEPTLMGIAFFERSVSLASKYRKPGQRIVHTIQTNGILIDDEWARFLARNRFLVGLSLDGPKEMHDAYRVAKGGRGTFDPVMRAWECLRRHDVDVNILCTVHAANQHHGRQVYTFFRDEMRASHLQFIPIVERVTPDLIRHANLGWSEKAGGRRPFYRQEGNLVTERSVAAEAYGDFLIAVFDEWVGRDVGKVFVQAFDSALASWLGHSTLCIFSPTCGNALALEHNGDLYACDHYVEPEFLLGNIKFQPMLDLMESPRQRQFGSSKFESLPNQCRSCDVLFACYGECPRNRFLKTPDGEPGLNYLCAGYQKFFRHIDKPMQRMASLLRSGRFADEIMGSR